MEIYRANHQWSTRPDDERFSSLQELYDQTKAYADSARERENVPLESLRVENIDGDVHMVGRGNIPATLTHWAFGQIAARIAAPADYLRTLPATLAAQNINHGLARRVEKAADTVVNLLFHLNGGYVLRALTSDRYERIWNYEVADRLLGLQALGWEPALPDIRADLDPNGPRASLYASDHDLFAFIRHTQRTVSEPGNPDGLQRGLIASNSEVGAGKLRVQRFLYREMCGNHIIWGARDVVELAAVHRGNIRDRFALWETEIRKYADTSVSDDETKIASAKTRLIAGTKEDVLDAIFGKRGVQLPYRVLEAGYDATVPDVDGDPRTPWGLAQGLTRYSQTTPYADKRTAIDIAAGKLLEAF